MYIVYENKNRHISSYFALTEEQLKDEGSKVLFTENTKEIARVNTIEELKRLNTPYHILYMRNGTVRSTSGRVRF